MKSAILFLASLIIIILPDLGLAVQSPFADTSLVYTSISRLTWYKEFPTAKEYFYSVQFSLFPSSTLAPIVYRIDSEVYDRANFYRYNLFDLLTSSISQPYQIKLFRGERHFKNEQLETLYGLYYTASFHSRIGTHIVPWHRYGIGLEHRSYKIKKTKAEVYQLLNLGLAVFGYEGKMMTVLVSSYSRKGLFPQRFISMENISFRITGRYSFASSLDRSLEATMGRSIAINYRNKTRGYMIFSAGGRLFVPVDLDLETMT
ncbi:MAG TPA: hypothetical protein ENN84_06810, partial [Candidatus Marinimicrobia bacterium]|nr:hypothetical protein [Candidatus Neomarinimicrobiota bacterium]